MQEQPGPCESGPGFCCWQPRSPALALAQKKPPDRCRSAKGSAMVSPAKLKDLPCTAAFSFHNSTRPWMCPRCSWPPVTGGNPSASSGQAPSALLRASPFCCPTCPWAHLTGRTCAGGGAGGTSRCAPACSRTSSLRSSPRCFASRATVPPVACSARPSPR